MRGMKDSEYKTCIDNLGLLEGEEIKLQYVSNILPTLKGSHDIGLPCKGLLVFTNDNMIFMQQEGFFSSKYGQRLRIPIENISGVVCKVGISGPIGGRLDVFVGIGGHTEEHKFVKFKNKQRIEEIRTDILKVLKEVRAKKKRLAQEALAGGILPTMIFCKYCGARNKADQTKCANCGAVLT